MADLARSNTGDLANRCGTNASIPEACKDPEWAGVNWEEFKKTEVTEERWEQFKKMCIWEGQRNKNKSPEQRCFAKSLIKAFEQIDDNDDRELSLPELQAWLKQSGLNDDSGSTGTDIFEKLDRNGDNMIDLSEWLEATTVLRGFQRELICQKATELARDNFSASCAVRGVDAFLSKEDRDAAAAGDANPTPGDPTTA